MADFGKAAEPTQETNIRAKPGELLARLPFEKDKVIFREGQDGTDAFVVESGRVGVFKTTDGKPVRLAVIEKGAIFGEMAAITGERRSATAIAIEPTIVVRISKTTIQQKISNCDPFIKALLAILVNNLGRVNERYATTNKVAEKLLNDLKTAHADKPVEKAAEKTEAAPAEKTGDRGVDGAPVR
jgi:CRP/FNR family cyclic AMP-dependent transcriptional regulator